MGRLRNKFNELLSQKRLIMALGLAVLISFVLGSMRFWEWFKYRVGIITAAMAMLSLDKWAVIIGILCTVITCLVNWYYERKKYLIALAGGDADE
ncbi:HP1 family phage holin [Klebsiella sp. WP4-W18-ESBL-05]|uniref:HP1 family phage holin n=1 Tax=Klebsiella sp. WP4-W18-ESBL-05 TaxID=2675713 RepID=UPI0015DC314C|nr:hypothetical protein WP4W18E05_23160 [Klebsiella sp. WP4-W18-ESBL-05]